jgi:caffeoyl-CoA O-methyltransferase
MEFLPKEIDAYVAAHTSPESELLNQLNRETHLKVLMPRMLSGHIQGKIISTFSHMIKPKRILEIGTYTGYSALCWAEGLTEDGKIITIDNNVELEKMCREYFAKSPHHSKIDFRIANAMELIPTLNEKWDIVFIDADKHNYLNYFDMVIGNMNKGGFIIADNVLWSGRILFELDKMDKDTRALYDYNIKVMNDPRVEPVLFPVRDGMMVCRVKN